MSYHAIIDAAAELLTHECGGCDWRGTFAQMDDIGDAVLTAGDPSPSGRCPDPDCGALCYAIRTEITARREAHAGEMFATLDQIHNLTAGALEQTPEAVLNQVNKLAHELLDKIERPEAHA